MKQQKDGEHEKDDDDNDSVLEDDMDMELSDGEIEEDMNTKEKILSRDDNKTEQLTDKDSKLVNDGTVGEASVEVQNQEGESNVAANERGHLDKNSNNSVAQLSKTLGEGESNVIAEAEDKSAAEHPNRSLNDSTDQMHNTPAEGESNVVAEAEDKSTAEHPNQSLNDSSAQMNKSSAGRESKIVSEAKAIVAAANNAVERENNLVAEAKAVVIEAAKSWAKRSDQSPNKSSAKRTDTSEQTAHSASPERQAQNQSPSKYSPTKHQHLSILAHSLNCSEEYGKCLYFPQCSQFKSLWNHLPHCNQPKCQVANCVPSRKILFEYMHHKRKAKQIRERQEQYSGAYCVAIVNKGNEQARGGSAPGLSGVRQAQQISASEPQRDMNMRGGVQGAAQESLQIQNNSNMYGGVAPLRHTLMHPAPQHNIIWQVHQTSQSEAQIEENDQMQNTQEEPIDSRLARLQADWSNEDNGSSDRYDRLCLLLHSSQCKVLPGQCTYHVKCPEAKFLWGHMSGCNDMTCRVKDCVLSCQILRDYFNFTKKNKQLPELTAPSLVDAMRQKNDSDSKTSKVPINRLKGETKEMAEIRLARLKEVWTKEDNGSSDRYDRLCFLLHSSECTTPPGECTYDTRCPEIKVLWKHMSGCNDMTCRVKDCVLSCQILRDYFNDAEEGLAESLSSPLVGRSPNKSSLPKQIALRQVNRGSNDAKTDQTPAVSSRKETTLVGKEKSAPKQKKSRLFRDQKAKPMTKTGAATQTTDKEQRQGVARNKVKKKPKPPKRHTLWDYDFDLSASSDSDEDYESLFQIDVDNVQRTILSKPLPTTSQARKTSDEMSLREAATLNSKVNRMKDQIRRADTIIQTTTPSYLVYQSKGWRQVDSTPIISNSHDSDTQTQLSVAPSQKFHASSNSAGNFLSLYKSTALKAFKNSNQSANEQVIAFLTIIRRSRDNPQQSHPYKLIKQVWKLIKYITEPLSENERESMRTKLKQKFDAFLPDGYSMNSKHYFLDDESNTERDTPEFVESCARTHPMSDDETLR